MKICTWNLWFSTKHQSKRMKECARVILKSSSDVVCLQEVTQSISYALLTHELLSKYELFEDVHSTMPYGNIFLVKRARNFKVDFFFSMPFPFGIGSNMNRRIYFLVLSNGITLLNVHLESVFNGPKGLKAFQLEYLLGYARVIAKSSGKKVFIVGDTNLSAEDDKIWSRKMIKQNGFVDIMHPEKEIFTYDHIENGNIQGKFLSRLDRFLCSDEDVKIESYELLGTQVFRIEEGEDEGERLHPSDHFGVQIKFV